MNETIPKPSELTDGTKHWRDVSTAYARFDVYLRQIAKVAIGHDEMNDMLNSERLWEKQISPNPFKVFIYTVEQLQDKNATREVQFRLDLQDFLRLKTPIIDFNKVTKSNVRDSTIHPEHMDICEPRYKRIRSQLLKHGKKTGRWINDKFTESSDVVVSSKDYFASVVSTWGDDPCQST